MVSMLMKVTVNLQMHYVKLTIHLLKIVNLVIRDIFFLKVNVWSNYNKDQIKIQIVKFIQTLIVHNARIVKMDLYLLKEIAKNKMYYVSRSIQQMEVA